MHIILVISQCLEAVRVVVLKKLWYRTLTCKQRCLQQVNSYHHSYRDCCDIYLKKTIQKFHLDEIRMLPKDKPIVMIDKIIQGKYLSPFTQALFKLIKKDLGHL